MMKLLHLLLLVSMSIPSASFAADLPVKLISVQLEQQSKESQASTPDDMPIVLTGESNSAVFAVGDVAKSYDFALYNAAKRSDTGQSHSGFAYVVNGVVTRDRPSGSYSFVLRYWLPKGATFPVALYYKGKPISNAMPVQGVYEGGRF